MNDSQKEAYSKIEANLSEIQKLIKECEIIAEENAVEFTLETPSTDIDYIPESLNKPHDWNSSETVSGWMTSSDYC